MNESQWRDSAEKQPAIGNVEAQPLPDEVGQLSRHAILRWGPIVEYLRSKLKLGDGLIEEFARAKVAQETKDARKTLEEAAEIAARREKLKTYAAKETTSTVAGSAKTLAEAKKISAEADKIRQEAFLEGIERIAQLPAGMQAAAMEALLGQSPAVAEQIERIDYLLEELRLKHGLLLTVAPAEEPASVE